MEALGRWGVPLMTAGRGDDEFRSRWLTLALPAILHGRTAAPPVEIGFEVESLLIVLRIDEDGPSARIGDENRPNPVLAAEADTVVGLVAGALTVDQALDAGELRGEAPPFGKRSSKSPPPRQWIGGIRSRCDAVNNLLASNS